MNYEQYQRAPAPEQNSLVNQARERIEGSLRLGPELVDTGTFLKDVYLLESVGFLDTHFDMLTDIQRIGAHPKVRGEFVRILKDQDMSGDSKELLATLAVGQMFDYHRELPFQTVFEKLAVKHEQLIAEARRQARIDWPPPESNAGKSSEWIAAQVKIARLWEITRQRLPQGIERETQNADKAYFHAGFNLLKDEIQGGAQALAIRAMIEYLIPRIWRQPRMVEAFFSTYEQKRERRRPLRSLSECDDVEKAFFVPVTLQGQTGRASKKEGKDIKRSYYGFCKAMHIDISATRFPDVSTSLQDYVDIVYKAVNSSWSQVDKLLKN